jgi:cardiolipin synthase
MRPTDKVYTVSDFTHELVANVRTSGYGPRAWLTLLARSWVRSVDDIRASPARTRSALRWSGVGASIGAGLLFLTLVVQDSGAAIRATALWLPWYAGTVFFVLTHLGMVDGAPGGPRTELLLPNALTFLRLGLAPLALWPFSSVPAHPSTAPVFALILVLLALTDAVDGRIARRRGVETRMGRMLDPLADLAFLAFLAAGLFAAGVLPTSLLALLMLRYPGVLVGVLVLYFLRGPAPLRPTVIGRVTSFVASTVLTAFAVARLLRLGWLPANWIDWCVGALYLIVGINLAYLVYQAVTWRASGPD